MNTWPNLNFVSFVLVIFIDHISVCCSKQTYKRKYIFEKKICFHTTVQKRIPGPGVWGPHSKPILCLKTWNSFSLKTSATPLLFKTNKKKQTISSFQRAGVRHTINSERTVHPGLHDSGHNYQLMIMDTNDDSGVLVHRAWFTAVVTENSFIPYSRWAAFRPSLWYILHFSLVFLHYW